MKNKKELLRVILVIIVLFLIILSLLVVIKRNNVENNNHNNVNLPINKSEFNLGPGDYEFNILIGGRERSYLIHVPFSYNTNVSIPIVLNFHGGGGSAEG